MPRPPCPKCGERGIALQIGLVEEVNIALPLEVALSPQYQEWDWKRRWEGAQQDFERVVARHAEKLSSEAINAAHRDLQSFYVRTYHIKDALKEDAPSLGLQPSAIEAAITNDPNLALLADLANLDKHYKLNRPPRSGATPKIDYAQGIAPGSGKGGWRLKVVISHGRKKLDGVDVAKAAIAAWRSHLQDWGLIQPSTPPSQGSR